MTKAGKQQSAHRMQFDKHLENWVCFSDRINQIVEKYVHKGVKSSHNIDGDTSCISVIYAEDVSFYIINFTDFSSNAEEFKLLYE